MKKTLFIVAIAGMASLVACGPSAEEKAKTEKAKADSLAKIRHDSLDMVAKKQKADDSAKAAQAKAADTTKAATDMKDGDKKEEKKK